MPEKPGAKWCRIKEQIVHDLATGLTLQFEAKPDGGCCLRIFGDFEFGNREIGFDVDGVEWYGETAVRDCPRPGWVRGKVSDEEGTT